MLIAGWCLCELARLSFVHFRNSLGFRYLSPPSRFLLQSSVPFNQTTEMSLTSATDTSDEVWEALDYCFNMETIDSKVVHTQQLQRSLLPGALVVINGRILPKCLRFSVDFTCGQRNSAKGTIAFHFNPRLQEEYVVRNSLQQGTWGNEETTFFAPFPFRSNEFFELEIYASEKKLFVNVNGRNFCAFAHRVPIQSVTSIDCVGEVEIKQVRINSLTSFPYMRDEFVHRIGFMAPDAKQAPQGPRLTIPYLGTFTEAIRPGWTIVLSGKVKLLPSSFYLNFQAGKSIHPHPDISLHINPRFNLLNGENALVKNSYYDGKWQKEERNQGFPFVPGQPFELAVFIDYKSYIILVNDVIIGEFRNEVKKISVDTLYVQGDIFLDRVYVTTARRKSIIVPSHSSYSEG